MRDFGFHCVVEASALWDVAQSRLVAGYIELTTTH